jgi:carboxylesterase
MERQDIGCLLVHGFNGGVYDMQELAEYLNAQGIVTHNVLLPGHGTQVHAMHSVTWKDWVTAVLEGYDIVRACARRVVLVGHSLGGALVLYSATKRPVDGVVALCAPLHLQPGLGLLVGITRWIVPFVPTLGEDISDPVARRVYAAQSYRWTSLEAAHNIFRLLPNLEAALPCITAPALIVTARRDRVVPPADSREIYRRIASTKKEFLELSRSSHVVMKDYDHAELFTRIGAFVHSCRELASDGQFSAPPSLAPGGNEQ